MINSYINSAPGIPGDENSSTILIKGGSVLLRRTYNIINMS